MTLTKRAKLLFTSSGRALARCRRGSSELVVPTIMTLAGVAAVSAMLPTMFEAGQTSANTVKTQAQALQNGATGSGGSSGASGSNGWSLSCSGSGCSVSGDGVSVSAGQNGVTASAGGSGSGSSGAGGSAAVGGSSAAGAPANLATGTGQLTTLGPGLSPAAQQSLSNVKKATGGS